MPDSVLVLAPHTDDGEFGCGGTIARFIAQGARVTYIAFCAPKPDPSTGEPPDALRREVAEATAVLGISPGDLRVLDFKVRHFPAQRQDILETLVALNAELKPDTVLLPSAHDTHQDHVVVAAEGFRAFKKTTMLGYELPWNNLEFKTTCFMPLDEAAVDKKVQALACYRSQRTRSYANEEFIRSLMVTRGTQIGTHYAEAFEVIRWIVR